jgi:hypothetical protein
MRIRNTVQCASHCRFQLLVYRTRSLVITITQIIKNGMQGQLSRVPNNYPRHFPVLTVSVSHCTIQNTQEKD